MQDFLPKFDVALDGLESRYRAHYLKADARQTSVAIAVWLVPMLLFACADYHLFGLSGQFAAMLTVRLVFAAFSLYTIAALAKVATPREYDGIFLRWAAAGIVVMLVCNYSWAEYVTPNGAITVLVLFSSYMVFPNRLGVRIVPPILLSVGNLALQLWVVLPFSPLGLFVTVVALVMANVLGIIFSTWLQNLRRTEFVARLEESRVKEEFSRLASVDDLTGAFNRRKVMELAAAEYERFRGGGWPLAFLMIDIDHFKQLNDNFGHEAGDLVLANFAAYVAHGLPHGAIWGRLGGDEFVLILPNATGEQAAAVAERLRLGLTEPMVWHGTQLIFTICIGVTEARVKDKACVDVLKRADKALYRAKRHGRNRTEVL